MKNKIKGAISELGAVEKREREKSSKLHIFSKRLRGHLLRDKRTTEDRKKLCEKGPIKIDDIKGTFPKKELYFSEKDVSLARDMINLTRKNIIKEEAIKKEIRSKFSTLSDDSKGVLKKIFMHVSGEEVLDKKELRLELESAKIFSLILDLIKKKFELIKEQNEILDKDKSKDKFKKLQKKIEVEESINSRLLSLVNSVLGIESKESAAESKKKKLIKPPSHAKRNMAVVAVILIIAVSAYMFQPRGEELTMSHSIPVIGVPEGTLKYINADDIRTTMQRPLEVKAKTEFLNSLMKLYYFASQECIGKTCLLDETAINALLAGERKLKKEALSAYQISFKDNVLKLRSERPLSTKAPGSAGQGTIYLDNVVWRISEINGDFEFDLIEGRAWLTISALGGLGNIFKKKESEIYEIPDIKKARLFRYTAKDGSRNLYGAIYDSNEVVKNGVDLSTERFATVNKFPDEEKTVIVAFTEQ